MNFDLDDDQRAFEQTLLDFFQRDLPLPAVRDVMEGTGTSDDLWKHLASFGVLGMAVAERHGGLGLELLDLAVAAETLGFVASPGPFLEHVVAALAISLGGSEAQQARWLPGLADGTVRATVALAEDGRRWLPGEWRLPGGERLAGRKRWVLNPAGADLLVVGTRGGLALVERSAVQRVDAVEALDLTRRLAHVDLDGPAEPLGGDGDVAGRVIDAALILLAADAAGAARRCTSMAVDYAKHREQFGVTIGHFQALKHQLADLALESEPLRGLYWYAAHAWDHVAADRAKFAALAKAHVTERAVDVGRRAIEAHGGIGYTWEADVHLFLKRALFDRAYLGSPSQHRATVAALHGWPTVS